MAAGKTYIIVAADTRPFKTEMNTLPGYAEKTGRSITQKMNAGFSKMRNVGQQMSTRLTLPIVAAGTLMFKQAADMTESINKVNVIFENSAGIITDWSKSTADNMGISRNAALEAAGNFGNLFNSMQITGPEAANMSKSMIQLGADMASFNNASPEETLQALGAGLRGETEPLRRFGVLLDAAAVEEEALRLGLVKEGEQLSRNAKGHAVYSLMMQQTAKQQGDFARTSEGAANQQRIIQARFQDTAATLGEHLLPIGSKILSVVASLAEKFGNLSPGMQKVILIALGVAAAIGPLMTVIGGLGSAIMLLANPVGLIVAGIAALVAGFIYAYKNFEGFRNVVDGVVDFLLKYVWPAIQSFAKFVMEIFSGVIKWVQQNWPAISEAIGHVFKVITTIVKAFIAPFIFIWKAWGDDILNIVKAVWGFIGRFIKNAITIIKNVIMFFVNIINGDWGKAWTNIKNIAAAIWDQIKNIIGTAIKIVKSVIGGVVSTIKAIWTGAWNLIKSVAAGIWNWIIDRNRGVRDTIVGIWKFLGTVLKNVWSGAWNLVQRIFGNVAATLLKGVRWLVNKILGLLEGLIEKVHGVSNAFRFLPGEHEKMTHGALDAIRNFRAGTDENFGAIIGKLDSLGEKEKTTTTRTRTETGKQKSIVDGWASSLVNSVGRTISAIGDSVGKAKELTSTLKNLPSDVGIKVSMSVPSGDGLGILGSSAGGGSPTGMAQEAIMKFGGALGSGYRPGSITASGNLSLHSIPPPNNARDFGGSAGQMLMSARYLADKYGARLRELIHTPLGFGIKNGVRVPLSYFGETVNAMHYNHVHVADRGKIVKGPALIAQGNITEAHVPLSGPGAKAWRGAFGSTYNVDITINGDADGDEVEDAVYRGIERARSRDARIGRARLAT